VTGGARTSPSRAFGGDWSVVRCAAHVAEVSSQFSPPRAMAGARTGECVRDLVQQDLVNAVVVETLGEMA